MHSLTVFEMNILGLSIERPCVLPEGLSRYHSVSLAHGDPLTGVDVRQRFRPRLAIFSTLRMWVLPSESLRSFSWPEVQCFSRHCDTGIQRTANSICYCE